jgi:hypothetical protein
MELVFRVVMIIANSVDAYAAVESFRVTSCGAANEARAFPQEARIFSASRTSLAELGMQCVR